MRISDWSSDVCSSDLIEAARLELEFAQRRQDYTKMSEIQYGRMPELEKQLKAAQEAETQGFSLLQDPVTAEENAELVAPCTGIHVRQTLKCGRAKMLHKQAAPPARVGGTGEKEH